MREQERPHPLLIDRHQNGDEGGVGVGMKEAMCGGEGSRRKPIKLR